MSKPSTLPVWEKLKAEQKKRTDVSLDSLFSGDADRANKYAFSVEGLTLDLSRNHVTDKTLDLLVQLAKDQGLADWRQRLFSGDKINTSEHRAVLHTALRTPSNDPILVDGQDVIPDIRALQQKMEKFVTAVRNGHWKGATGRRIRTIVNIGIGGSDLGPRLAVKALSRFSTKMDVGFVANVDASETSIILKQMNPATTLFVVVSKTFTTQETLMNAKIARQWLVAALGEEAVAKHFVAVSTNLDAVQSFGIAPDNIFPMWDWVGGRYSLWSSVGLSLALAIGYKNFKAMLAGAAAMDAHFQSADFHQNLPTLLALMGVWYRNFWGSAAHAILPYDERLRDLFRYLQQLQMESNGKSVTREGLPVDYPTCPVIFGECGTVGQHSFHQWLHQGTDRIPVDFIGIRTDDWDRPEAHAALTANLKAQAQALQSGLVCKDQPYRTNPGNKPSNLIWLEKLDPYSFGLLLALYEHKTFVEGVVWGINSFDQWGVELGKKLAAKSGS